MLDNETDNTKRKRGRPKKEKAVLPVFTDVNEISEYILNTSLELSLECKDIATKKNNIKKPAVANAKNQQYKTAITSLKVANDILKDIQINKLEEKVKLMQEGLVATNNTIGTSTETLEKINKLSSLTEQLAQLKE